MSFDGQPNMFFGKIISCTCDLHLKLDILNLLNFFLVKWLKKWVLFLTTLSFNFSKLLKEIYNLIFHQVHFMNMYFHRKGHIFIVQIVWNQLYDFMHSFLFLFKIMQFKHLIQLVYMTQNDIYIVSKLF